MPIDITNDVYEMYLFSKWLIHYYIDYQSDVNLNDLKVIDQNLEGIKLRIKNIQDKIS